MFNARPNDPGARFDAGAACPAYTVEAEAAMMVAAKQARDEACIKDIVASGRVAVSYTYLDGSMHPSFREILRAFGPARLQALTSGPVEVGRPDAALAEPSVTLVGSATERLGGGGQRNGA